jgi:hypothetical protein
MKTEKWPVDQLFPAADLLVETDWKVPKATDPRVAALAATVGRTAGAVRWKLANLKTAHPQFLGIPTHHTNTDQAVVAVFYEDLAGAKEIVKALKR